MNSARYSYLKQVCKLVELGKDIVIVSEDYAAPEFGATHYNMDDIAIVRGFEKGFHTVGILAQNIDIVIVSCGSMVQKMLAIAEDMAHNGFYIGCHHGLTKEELQYEIQTISDYLSQA